MACVPGVVSLPWEVQLVDGVQLVVSSLCSGSGFSPLWGLVGGWCSVGGFCSRSGFSP